MTRGTCEFLLVFVIGVITLALGVDTRAIERLRATVRDLNREIEKLEDEIERRAKRRKERRR